MSMSRAMLKPLQSCREQHMSGHVASVVGQTTAGHMSALSNTVAVYQSAAAGHSHAVHAAVEGEESEV